MVTLQDLSFDFAGRWLYQDVNWQIAPGDKIGLIGKNGTGKSTLLRLITNEYRPTEGLISKDKNLNIGFLNQDLLSFSSDAPLFEVVLSAFEQQKKLHEEIESLLQKLETDYDEDLIHVLGEKQELFQQLGGYEMEARTHEILSGLGFKESDRHNPYDTFSGGWRMRAMLAQILLREPDLLLLDEPTNHLDLPSIEWLESYIQHFKGAFIIVSHDRYFLDRMVNKIVEVAHQRLHFYTGNYSKYLVEKEERMTIHRSAYENQQKLIGESERFIERFKAKASKASQAQSRIKLLDKLERIPPPEDDRASISFSFQVKVQPGVDIMKLEVENKQYGDKVIIKKSEAVIRRGDKIGLIGPNGVGKSTLLRLISGSETFEGKRTEGYNLITAHFAQHQLESLNLENSIWEEMVSYASDQKEPYIRTILGCFLFSGDDVEKKIKVLSGGEKSRVALAKTLLTHANFMLLDEPTNHLDMQSIEILIDALSRYTGSFVLVSHDRYFLSKVANKIWYIEEQKIKEYPGTFAEFEEWKSRQIPTATSIKAEPVKVEVKKENKPKEPVANEAILKKKLKQIEESLEKLEAEKRKLEDQLSDSKTLENEGLLNQLTAKYETIMKDISRETENWENVFVELDS